MSEDGKYVHTETLFAQMLLTFSVKSARLQLAEKMSSFDSGGQVSGCYLHRRACSIWKKGTKSHSIEINWFIHISISTLR